jgi:hypothetical protein
LAAELDDHGDRGSPRDTFSLLFLAYGSFLFCGLLALAVGIVDLIPMNDTAAAGIVFFLLIPLGLLGIGLMLVGTALSIRLWRHWPLPLLSVLLILAIIAAKTGSVSEATSSLVYGLCVTVLSVRGFFVTRRNERLTKRGCNEAAV